MTCANQAIHAIGNATTYLPKTFLTENDIDPEKGFEMVIVAKE